MTYIINERYCNEISCGVGIADLSDQMKFSAEVEPL